jgi:hypothetical protein
MKVLPGAIAKHAKLRRPIGDFKSHKVCKDTLLEFTGVKRVMEGAVGKTQNYRTD